MYLYINLLWNYLVVGARPPNRVIVQAGGSVGGLQVAGGFVINYIYQC